MDLRKLPPSMVLALGLVACGDDGPSESDTGPCLSIDPTEVGSASDTDSTGTAGSTGTGGDSTVGPCLSPEPQTTGTDTGPGSESGSGTGTGGSGTDSGSGSGSGSSGGMAVGEPAAPTRADAVERVLDRGTLPPDVAARLRARAEKG